ncbi:MAG: NnrS family protein [Candidatus Eremiobacteraeota bacterium]|nr:NnrS family protein [Candidatus Eremiobacteraeota bacterium]MCW5871037.1 NnrS family protein [Candidatus Eremiobacteraeota bacterium]
MAPLHRPFLNASLAFVVFGTLLGLLMLPFLAHWQGWESLDWVAALRAHGQMQVFGFAVLFTMGIAYQMLGELLNARQSPTGLQACLGLMVVGTLGQALYPCSLWPWCQFFSGLIFVAGVARHRSPPGTVRRNLAHSHYLRWGSLWLLAALALNVWGAPAARVLELVLWGFLSLYILGVGLRVHPAMLNRTPPSARVQWTVLALWNLGLVLSFWPALQFWCALSWTVASLLLVLCLRPWPRGPNKHDWPLPAYLGWSYAWLVTACLGRLLGPDSWAGAIKHAHASGFVLTMMVGMGLRLVPAFERRTLAWPSARRLCLWLLAAGTVLRVLGQAGLLPGLLVPGGVLQFSALFLFVAALVDLGQGLQTRTPLGFRS